MSWKLVDHAAFFWICEVVAFYFELLFHTSILLFLGLYLKPGANILASIAIVYATILFYDISLFGNLVPLHYINKNTSLTDFSNLQEIRVNTLIAIGLCVAVIVGLKFLGRKKIDTLQV